MRVMPAQPEYLRAGFAGRPVGVDRKNEVLQGYVVAQEGPFKSDGRGEFDEAALREIVRLGNAPRGGLKARFTHPDMSSDGLGKFLGRSREFSMGTAIDARTGKQVKAVRADLHFDPSAHQTPSGDLAKYVMDLAESDPNAISSSIVVKADREFRLNKDGTPQTGPNGEELPPLWRPTALHASDIVDEGDAVDGLLSSDQWANVLRWDHAQRLGAQVLDRMFAGQPREVVESRAGEFLKSYLSRKFGDDAPVATPRLDARAARLAKMTAAAKGKA